MRVCVFKTITTYNNNNNNNNNGIFHREECWVSVFEGIDAKADAKANESKTKQKDEHLFGGASGSEGDFHARALVDDDGREDRLVGERGRGCDFQRRSRGGGGIR